MKENNYYLEYLKNASRFPRSIYNKGKHDAVRDCLSGLPFGARVLDAGCGLGQVTGKYAGQYRIFGLDDEESAVQYCREHWNGNYVRGGLYDIPFEDNFFDSVVFLDVIEHLKEPVIALRELARVLKPGASILICTINYANLLWSVGEYLWYPLFGGSFKPYSREVHPTRYTDKLLREHCVGLFEEIYLVKRVMRMELFYLGKKPLKYGDTK